MRLWQACLVIASFLNWFAPPAETGEQRNRAYWYNRAAEVMNRLSGEDLQHLSEFARVDDRSSDDRVRSALANASMAIDYLQRAQREDFVLFQHDSIPAPLGSTQYVGSMRLLGSLLAAQAKCAFEDGSSATGVRQIQTLLAMARDLGQDGNSLSGRRAATLLGQADALIHQQSLRGALEPADCMRLQSTFQEFSETDPVGLRSGFVSQFEEAMLWLDAQRDGEAATPSAEVNAILSMSDAAFEETMAGYDRFFEELTGAIGGEGDAGAALAELQTRAANGEFGPMCALLLDTRINPFSLEQLWNEAQKAEELVANRLAECEKVLALGTTAVLLTENAAYWYYRAMDEIEQSSIERFLPATFEELIAGKIPARPMEIDLAWGKAREYLLEGSRMTFCDFSIRADQHSMVAPEFLTRWEQAARLLECDAMTAADGPALFVDVTALLRMIRHLSDHRRILSSVLSHQEAIRVSKLIERGHARGWEPTDETIAALRSLPQHDPFGYLASLAELRRTVKARWLDKIGFAAEQVDQLQVHEMADDLDADRVYALMLVMIAGDYEEGGAIISERVPDSLANLRDDAIQFVKDAELYVNLLATPQELKDHGLPLLDGVGVTERVARARAGMRSLTTWYTRSPSGQ